MTVTVATLAERALRRLGVAVVPAADRPALTVTIPAASLATDALLELGIIASDETPSDADQTLALANVAYVHDSLVGQGIVAWTLDTVPQAVSEEYVKLAAIMMASSFGKAADPQIVPMLEGRVRRYALLLSAQDRATEAVMAVHNDLSARGRVRWTVWDIPSAAELPYEMLAAFALAPKFDKPQNAAEVQIAQRALAQIIALPTSGEHVYAEYF